MSIATFRVEFNGTMPLLMHRDSIEGREEVQQWIKDPANKKKSVAGDDRTPAWTWRTYLYHDGNNVAMPFDNLQRAMSQGATEVKIGKGQKTWKEESISQTQFASEFLKFECCINPADGFRQISMADISNVERMDKFVDHLEAVKKLGFSLYCKPVRVGTAKHIRVRPRFEHWRVTTLLHAADDRITAEVVRQWFTYAGKKGLCDGRPASPKTPGPFGTFEAKVIEA